MNRFNPNQPIAAGRSPLAADCSGLQRQNARNCNALGGLDTLVFAGGIGENAPLVRARICEGLAFLGIEINEARNTENAPVISTDAGRVAVRVIRTTKNS